MNNVVIRSRAINRLEHSIARATWRSKILRPHRRFPMVGDRQKINQTLMGLSIKIIVFRLGRFDRPKRKKAGEKPQILMSKTLEV